MAEFSQRLKGCRELMKRKNPIWTQGYVAEKVGVARSTYTAYENGTKQPPIGTINALADLFEVSSDYLLGREEKKYPSSRDEEEFEAWVNDPSVDKFYREFKESPEERKKALLAVWEILKTQGK